MSNAAQLNQFLFETLQGVKDGTVDAEKAKSITGIAQTMINNARAEIDFLKANGSVNSAYFAKPSPPALTNQEQPNPAAQTQPETRQINGKTITQVGNVTTVTTK